MTPYIPLFGALALAGGLAAATFQSPATEASRSKVHAASTRTEDPVLFYRDPMSGRDLSRLPTNDRMGMDYLPMRRSDVASLLEKLPPLPVASRDEPLFYRDPMGGSDTSSTPKKDGMGMDYLPVRPADIAGLLPALGAAPAKASVATGKRRILYYRNPMGLPDTSLVPKKDPMGMDYAPVLEGEDDDQDAFKLTPGKIQRAGVRSETVRRQALVATIRVPGSIQLDERRVAVVATRSEAFIEKVADVTTGDRVVKGQVLARLYSPAIAAAAADYLAVSASPSAAAATTQEGARRRLETLNVPEGLYAEIIRYRKVPTNISWPAPRDGLILERNAVDGMKAEAGQVLFRIADLSVVWALIDVAEFDYARLRVGQSVAIRVRGIPDKAFAGRVALIYPQVDRETRTARVRVELANPDLVLRPDMYVEADILGGESEKVATVPESAVIDTGKRQLVLLDKGDGRFEPREIVTGRRGEGFVEVKSGVEESDRVVTAANFLIDAESNLKAALRGLDRTEAER